MAKNVVQYDLLISCPGDIQDELKIIEEVVAEFNVLFSDALGLSIRTKHWSKSSYPESGDTPQNLLNKQIVKDCDAAIAIFWTRFGTPTDEYGSGTEEEIEQMLEAGKQVFMYFSDKPQAPSKTNTLHKDYIKIQAFKTKYKDRGIYWPYISDDEFRQLFFAHLSQYFLSLKRVQEISQQKESKISIKSISEKGFCDIIYPLPFDVSSYRSSTEMMDAAKILYRRISEYNILKIKTVDHFKSAFYKPVEISKGKKDTITIFAEKMNLDIGDDFFNLGGLSKNTMSMISLNGTNSVEGNPDELAKYNDILELYKQIINLTLWIPFENHFKNYMCIKLAAMNEGTTFDEDIEITLIFNKKMIVCHRDLPVAGEASLKYILNECSLYDIFSIQETAQYNNYKSSIKQHYLQPSPSYANPLINNVDYTEEYLDELDSIFEYKIFEEDDIIVKLHIDYLKHKTAVAFPTVIFITNDLADVPYTITSKRSDKVVSGVLKVSQ